MIKLFGNLQKVHSVYYALIILLAGGIGFFLYQRKLLNRCNKITVATYVKYQSLAKTGSGALFTYQFNGQTFNTNDGLKNNDRVKEGRVFLKLSCEQPSIANVYWDIPVPDTLTFVPTNGWNDVPYGLDKSENK